MHLTVSGIVLKVQPSGDSDRLCTILTDTHGVIYAVARGAKSMKNKNAAATAQFVYGHFELFRRKELYIIDESQPEELYAGLREDIVRLTVAQYICQRGRISAAAACCAVLPLGKHPSAAAGQGGSRTAHDESGGLYARSRDVRGLRRV